MCVGTAPKTVAEMTMEELTHLRNRLYAQIRENKSERLDQQLHAVQGEMKDRGYVTKKRLAAMANCESCEGDGIVKIAGIDVSFTCPACHGSGVTS